MKKFSKVLCLVLVLAMMAGLCCFGTSAAYADADKIQYKEAVEVLSALKILQGDDNGFRPQDGLTRAEACKIISYVLGQETLSAACSFKDCKNHWAASYIAYCAAEGIVNGVGGNKFDPEGALTGNAFAKMLLCAVGYDADYEGMTGDTWEIGVAKLVKSTKLSKGIAAFDGTKAITREEAAQLALNAMKLDTKNFKKGMEIQGTGLSITAGGEYKADGDSLLKQKNVNCTEKNHDAFGRPAVTYKRAKTNKDTKIDLTFTKTPVYTTDAAMTEKDLFAAVDAEGIQGKYDKMIVMDSIWRDGVEVATVDYTDAQNYTVKGDAAYADTAIITKNSKSNIAGMGNGIFCELYEVADSANHYVMVLVNQFVAEVTGVTKANDKTGAKRNVTVSGGKTFDTEDFAKKDVVIYTAADGKIKSMELAELVSGKLTKIANGKVFTVDGEEYKMHDNVAPIFDNTNLGGKVSFYVDGAGYIMKKDTAEAKTDYLMVLANKAATQDYIIQGAKVGDFYGVLADGTVVENGKFEIASSETVSAGAYAGKLFSYTVDSESGNYKLVLVDDTPNDDDIAKNLTKIDEGVMNSETTFVFVETKTATDKTVKDVVVKTGIANLGGGITNQYLAAADAKGTVKVVFVCEAFENGYTSTDVLVYVDASTKKTDTEDVQGKTTTTYTYDAFKADGTKVSVTSTKVNLSADAIYVLNEDDTISTVKTGVKDGVVKAINGNSVTFTVSAVDSTLTCDVEPAFVAELDTTELEANQKVMYVLNKDGAVDAIWVYGVVTV